MSQVPTPRIDVNSSKQVSRSHADERPTWVRYRVLALLAVMTFVLYLDRVCIGQAAPMIQRDLGFSNTALSFVIGAFTLAYAVFEIPTGRWGDRYGSRGVLTRIVVWWSFFTALTGAATGLGMLLVVRFLFGAGEAGALPNSARILRQWFPESARGEAQGIVTTGMMLGGAVAPVAAQFLIDGLGKVWRLDILGWQLSYSGFGWRWTFAVFGVIGLVWAVSFYLWFRDNPADHREVNRAECELIRNAGGPERVNETAAELPAPDLMPVDEQCAGAHEPIPWEKVLSCANIWLLGGAMMTMSGVYYVLFSWYPTYLQSARGVKPGESSWLTSMVLGSGAVGCYFGGRLTDWLVAKTGNRRWGRTAQSVAGAGLAAAGLLASILTESYVLASVFVAMACFGVQIQVPAWWASATQVSGRHLGALFGMMNMLGAVGGILSPIFLGWFSDWMKAKGYTGRAQWDPGFYVYVGIALIGMTLWILIDPEKTVERHDVERQAE
jgi:ACS family glucarate transporter-like MFS transporter